MSINGVFRTSVSGMNAQANKLSAVSDNIANSSTTGYKRADVEFSTLVLDSGGGGAYQSGSVLSQTRRDITQQGSMTSSTSATDLAIEGDGFFIVQSEGGQDAYTRAGAFVQKTIVDDNGAEVTYLVNAAGQRLSTKNEANQTVPITLPVNQNIAPVATENMDMKFQLPSSAVVGDKQTTSVVVYDQLGTPQTIRVTAEKTAGAAAGTPPTSGTWNFNFTNEAGASIATAGPIAFGLNGNPTAAAGAVNLALADGSPVVGTFSGLTQFNAPFSSEMSANGNPAGFYESFSVTSGGVVTGRLGTGQTKEIATLSLARFKSADQLEVQTGNLFFETRDSGAAQFGKAGDAGFGTTRSGALEESNVDIAEELTAMIVSQKNYTANSKVFQTGSEMLDLLVNLKR
ncbi:flagellar hook protein FlgE [Fulvimarina endophytica]|uniref:Flagellar hook protein FlgE n=1 Tax=Fulvimarina endophytica TaxID=2293836 RepID=A0A371X8D3_9HYPH|nr:flagellar hook protein FlgE [Fulvimarina endophytica]RFC65461.1 flagellar hook protein FlgE [Fulvimarina endophytica]